MIYDIHSKVKVPLDIEYLSYALKKRKPSRLLRVDDGFILIFMGQSLTFAMCLEAMKQ
jgi:hypothetical protein